MGGYAEQCLVRGLGYLAEVQSSIAHNLANVDTTSYKRRAAYAQRSEQSFHSLLDANLPTIRFTETTDLRPGTQRETSNRFDVALDGPFYLRVQGENGRTYYTRNGQLAIGAGGRLTTRDGMSLLDVNGQPIQVGTGDTTPSELAISPNGTISDPSTGQSWGPLAVVKLADPGMLVPRGNGLYADPANQKTLQAADGVQQGYLEGSNVDSLQELVQMITVERTFTATQRALSGVTRMQETMIDQMLR